MESPITFVYLCRFCKLSVRYRFCFLTLPLVTNSFFPAHILLFSSSSKYIVTFSLIPGSTTSCIFSFPDRFRRGKILIYFMIYMGFWPYESGTDESGFRLKSCITHHTYRLQYCHFSTRIYNPKASHETQIEVLKQ